MKPKICVSLIDEKVKDIVESAKEAKQKGADLVELRLDFLPNLSVEKIEKITKLIQKLGLPSILTIRRENSGGHFPKEKKKEQTELLLSGAKNVSFVDIELETNEKIIRDFVKEAKKLGSEVIISSHNFEETPSIEKVLEILEREKELGADICKFVCKANASTDNLIMLNANLKFKKRKIAFCVGELGILSRVLAPIFGSELTFASLERGKEAGSGQLDIDTTKLILSKIGGHEND